MASLPAPVTTNPEVSVQFRNPENNDLKTIFFPRVWALLFGPFYFLIHGIWRHVIIYVALTTFFAYATEMDSEALFFYWFLIHTIYALCAYGIVKRHYRRKGWERLFSETEALVDAGVRGGILSFLWRLIR